MIFIGYNSDIGFARYLRHHSRFTDNRCLPRFICIWWNNLKREQPIWQILEWSITYGKPYCEKCMHIFIENGDFLYYNGIKNPNRQDRIDICNRLRKRFK